MMAVLRSAFVGGAGIAAAASYLGWVRPWHLRWGATQTEVRMDMPGDELHPHPLLEATRAVTIEAPPDEVWPWIVQMGYRRGGFYAIDLVDNDGRPSAERVVPELQDLAVGDVMPTSPVGGFTVQLLEPPHALAMTFGGEEFAGISMRGVVAMLLTESAGGTRLVCRLRADFGSNLTSRLYYLLFEPGDFVMMRLMMLGIKERAEGVGPPT
jgi:uncharacterized protein YndB with AHSA1/START domain